MRTPEWSDTRRSAAGVAHRCRRQAARTASPCPECQCGPIAAWEPGQRCGLKKASKTPKAQAIDVRQTSSLDRALLLQGLLQAERVEPLEEVTAALVERRCGGGGGARREPRHVQPDSRCAIEKELHVGAAAVLFPRHRRVECGVRCEVPSLRAGKCERSIGDGSCRRKADHCIAHDPFIHSRIHHQAPRKKKSFMMLPSNFSCKQRHAIFRASLSFSQGY